MGNDDEDFNDERKSEVFQKMRKARQNIIQEILVTEESYINDLKSCVDVFFQPEEEEKFQESKIDVYMLFSNYKEIYELAQNFLELLNKRVKHVDFDKQIVGQCFLDMTDELKMVYSEYCANSDGAMAYLQKYDQNPLLIQKLNQLKVLHEDTNKSMSIMSMLIKPVQRITKYPILLLQLQKATEESHVDFNPLVEANEAIQIVVNAVNESKRTRELVTKYKRKSESTLWDKFSNINRHSFQKKLNRARGYIAVNSGLYTEIKDEIFVCKLNEFMSTQKTVYGLCDNFCSYVETFEETMMNFCNLALHVKELYGDEAFASVFVSSLLELSRIVTTTICPSVGEATTLCLQMNFGKFGNGRFDNLDKKTVIQSTIIHPLSTLLKSYEGPVALINKRWDKLMEIQGDDKLDLVKKEYEALNNQLIKELPKLCQMSAQIVLHCLAVFRFVQETYLGEWQKHLDQILTHIGSKKEPDHRIQQATATLSCLRFNQFVDDNYPVGLLANVLMNVPVLNPMGCLDNKFNQPHRYSMPPLQRKSLAGNERAARTMFIPGSNLDSLKSLQKTSDIPDASFHPSQKQICSIVITPSSSADDGFYYAKCPYYARMNQHEVSLYDGQFVTVIDKKDGNNNSDWWQIFTDDLRCGYCPAICLDKAENFMDFGQLPDLKELDFYNSALK